ncbi:MAG: T9SS type A sorting domain-containing protein [Ignavibacteriales bacterium]|nr:T9SS type A sorting domain-containing protein [Ignavibacteriales bacterium]MCF8315864.1 T9SS type A sorting domain-containing protein [Ignavibacteriales bacterium]MCF8437324.1 T9SS type A sorting domain-containing protein [Ignavibacteriales bacterium]
MKQKMTVFLLISLFFAIDNFGQAAFETGKIAINLSDYGRIRVLAPDANTRQIDRSSILVAKSANEVFDYYNDGETEEVAMLITSPFADFTAYGSTNNNYNSPPVPPNVISKLYIYGWSGQGYVIVKSVVKSTETAAFDAIVGLEMIPQLDGVYGNELLTCDLAANLLMASTTNSYVGYQMLGENLYSSKSIDWYDGYQVDSDYYTWLTTPAADHSLQTGGDGGVGMFAKNPVTVAPGDSVVMYFAIAHATSETEMRANLDLAGAAFDLITSVNSKGDAMPTGYSLHQNYPNPFNPSTVIAYELPEQSFVSIKVYDVLGKQVASLVNDVQNAGYHQVSFNAGNLSSGVYFYQMETPGFTTMNKMLLSK